MLFFVRIDNFLDPKLAAVMPLFHSTFRFAVIFLLYSSWYCETKGNSFKTRVRKP